MRDNNIRKIAVIGNAGGGKTVLSRRLGKIHSLPVVHVDAIQFISGMKIRPHKESIAILNEHQDGSEWIIDGYGPLDILEKRFKLADHIVLIDFPLWRHYWWAAKRQVTNLWSPRKELPEGCDEKNWEHTKKLFKTIKQVHRLMRPELLRILGREELKNKVTIIKSVRDWNSVYRRGISASHSKG
jgi:adenylate kinase family enzyme